MVPRPPLVDRAEALGLACPPGLGELVHLLAAQRGRRRIACSDAALAAWAAAAAPPGVAVYVAGGAPPELFADDPDVHLGADLDAEAPFDLVAGDVDAARLLAPGGTAVLTRPPDGLPALDVGPGHVAVRL